MSAQRPRGKPGILHFLAGALGKWIIAAYYLTVKIVNEPELEKRLAERPQPKGVFAFWHSHQLSALWHFRKSRAAILISASRDGEYIARVAKSVGFEPVRGSSSRFGAAGLKGLVELAREGKAVAITPDGPRGPRYSIGPGALVVAQKSGETIIPIAIGLSKFWELPSWDRFRIPTPFAKGYACTGEPVEVPADADDKMLRKLADELRVRMMELEKRADEAARELKSKGRKKF